MAILVRFFAQIRAFGRLAAILVRFFAQIRSVWTVSGDTCAIFRTDQGVWTVSGDTCAIFRTDQVRSGAMRTALLLFVRLCSALSYSKLLVPLRCHSRSHTPRSLLLRILSCYAHSLLLCILSYYAPLVAAVHPCPTTPSRCCCASCPATPTRCCCAILSCYARLCSALLMAIDRRSRPLESAAMTRSVYLPQRCEWFDYDPTSHRVRYRTRVRDRTRPHSATA